jgi:hypothetical protein
VRRRSGRKRAFDRLCILDPAPGDGGVASPSPVDPGLRIRRSQRFEEGKFHCSF